MHIYASSPSNKLVHAPVALFVGSPQLHGCPGDRWLCGLRGRLWLTPSSSDLGYHETLHPLIGVACLGVFFVNGSDCGCASDVRVEDGDVR